MKHGLKAGLLAAVASAAMVIGLVIAPSSEAAGPKPLKINNNDLATIIAVVEANNLLNNNHVMILDDNFKNINALNHAVNHNHILNDNNINVQVLTFNNFLSNNNITLTDFLNNWDVNHVVSNFLNNNDVDAIVGVLVLPVGAIVIV